MLFHGMPKSKNKSELSELRAIVFAAGEIFDKTNAALNAAKDAASLVWDISIHEALTAHMRASDNLTNAENIFNAAVRTANGEVF